MKLGVLLCEDGWTENYYYNVPELLKKNGAQILCNLSCSPYTFHKNRKRHELFVHQSSSCGIPLAYCNNVGIQNNGKNVFTYDGCSCMYNARGEMITDSPAFQEDLLVSLWDPDTGLLQGERGLQPALTDAQAVYTALRYGASLFLDQLGIRKMTIGVSGGIDSAVTAAFYVDILGPENVLLVNMPSQYNSELTKGLAQKMAEALGFPLERAVACQQVHGTHVAVVTEKDAGKGIYSLEDAIPEPDGMVTDCPQLPLLISFADCVPILLVDPKRGAIGAVHAGWRGSSPAAFLSQKK